MFLGLHRSAAAAAALWWIGTVGAVGFGQTFDTTVNLIANGDFELGAEENGAPVVPDWFEGPNPFELIAVGDDGSDGLQSVGYDTNVPSSQFDPSTWADWRSLYVPVTAGEKLFWTFRYKITNAAATPDGEILAETRGFAEVDANNNPATFVGTAGFEILYDTAGEWVLVEKLLEVPAGVTVLDLRFNQIFTMFTTLPWQGSFRLDDVAIYRELMLRADFDQNQQVDAADLAIWSSNFALAEGGFPDTGDANGDGAVDGSDLLIWQREFGASLPPIVGATSVPEPGLAAWACWAAAACGRRRRRGAQR